MFRSLSVTVGAEQMRSSRPWTLYLLVLSSRILSVFTLKSTAGLHARTEIMQTPVTAPGHQFHGGGPANTFIHAGPAVQDTGLPDRTAATLVGSAQGGVLLQNGTLGGASARGNQTVPSLNAAELATAAGMLVRHHAVEEALNLGENVTEPLIPVVQLSQPIDTAEPPASRLTTGQAAGTLDSDEDVGSILENAVSKVNGALSGAGTYLANVSQQTSERLHAFWSAVAREKERTAAGETVRPDPIGICIGFSAVAFAAYSIYRSKREANRIISLFEANTQIKELEEKARKGEPLPNIVVIRGTINADGRDVSTVSPRIDGLRDKVGEIEQPKNAWIEIARQAKRDPQLKGIADAVVERTGVDAADVPDVPEPGDTYARESALRGEGALVLSEILVARICAKHQRRTEDKKTKRVTIKRPCRNESYNCFHGRRVAEGLHLLDLDGTRADLDLPPADAVGLAGIPEPPPLFLPVNDVWTEFTHYLRRDGLTGPGGRHQRLDDLPPMRLSDPYTLLSEFIFVDVQSPGDLGGMHGNPDVLGAIAEAYRGRDGPAKFLWEPRGFYDSVKGGGYDDVPAYASARFRRTELVSASELTERAQAAARQNALNTPYCEPSFTREQLMQRRDQENCFRYTELAIPRGTPVTVLARPMVAEAGTGEGAECRIRLTSPLSGAEEVKESGDPKADRFRFRIRPGHTVENLLRLRDLNVNAYYGLAVVGLGFAGWAAAGYPGMGAG